MSFFSSQFEEKTPRFITIDGIRKNNKWKIPDNLNDEEKKVLKIVKKMAYKFDKSFCGPFCIGLDPLLGSIYSIKQCFFFINYR